jgi:tRNA A-37 threonylcarbamoyl transferase component Bud32
MRSADDAVFTPGEELLGKYRIERMLGRGGMGEVYLARNQFLDQPVAIKVLPLRRSTDELFKERMKREAQAGARLAHENLVKVLDGGITDDAIVYIVMEFLDGARTLRELVWQSRGFAPEDALAYGIQLLDGLAAVHAAGILHRDLKPENVVVLPGGRVKIIDFGLAKVRSSALRTTVVPEGQRLGTLHYMAPEQIFGGDVGPAADVHAAGLIVHEMIAGRHVFQQETDLLPSVLEVSIMHQLAAPTRLDAAGGRSVPKELADVVERMLAKEPNARPSALEAGAALERVLASLATADARAGAAAPRAGAHGTMMLPEGFVPEHPLGPFAPSEAVVTLMARAMERALGGASPAQMAPPAAWTPPPIAGRVPSAIDLTPSPVVSGDVAPQRASHTRAAIAGVVCGTALVGAALAGVLHLRGRAAPAGSGVASPSSPATAASADRRAEPAVEAPRADVAAGPSASAAAEPAPGGAATTGASAAPMTSASAPAPAAVGPGVRPAGGAPRGALRPASGMPGSGL